MTDTPDTKNAPSKVLTTASSARARGAALRGGAPIVRGLVLSGGGARGAYEAGVLSYIFQELPRDLVGPGCIKVFCGTSVGALHASFLAATAHMTQQNMGRLLEVWRGLRVEEMLRVGATDILRLPFEMRALFKRTRDIEGMLVNASNIQRVVARDIPWPQIARNQQDGLVKGLTVSATHIASGKTIVFIDQAGGGLPPWTKDERRVARAVRIGPLHALASAAIPMLFPPIVIGGEFFVDGGLRQNTPLSPALRLGCDRVLVIGLSHPQTPEEKLRKTRRPDEPEPFPGPFLLVGKILDALLLDHLDYDIGRMNGINDLIHEGMKAFGTEFLEHINRTSEQMRGAKYRHIDAMVIRPSRDLGEMATEFVESNKSRLRGVAGWVLRKIAEEDAANNSDLLSYLTFDGRLASAYMELGFSDAAAARNYLIEFFGDAEIDDDLPKT